MRTPAASNLYANDPGFSSLNERAVSREYSSAIRWLASPRRTRLGAKST
jgi:hypothetical protein